MMAAIRPVRRGETEERKDDAVRMQFLRKGRMREDARTRGDGGKVESWHDRVANIRETSRAGGWRTNV